MDYKPPEDIWQVDKYLSYNEPLPVDDPRHVDTEKGRGDFKFSGLLKTLGIKPSDCSLVTPKDRNYILFCGHMGCGKSTELRIFVKKIEKPELFYVVFLDVLKELDPNSLEYVDVLMGLAHKLFDRLVQDGIGVDQVHLSNLESWFNQKIITHEKLKDFSTEIKASVSAETGIPFLAKAFASFTSSFKGGSSYKTELRNVIKNNFTQFAESFNSFLRAAEDAVVKQSKGKKILFVVDGTDRLKGEDGEKFFIADAYQLQLIEANFIYCAPIHLLSLDNRLQNRFGYIETLPMIKVEEKEAIGEPFASGYEVMQELIYQRADKKLFDSEKTVREIIKYSGGCPRDLLKILHYAFLETESEKFDRTSVDKAIKRLSSEYRRFIDTDDYKTLYSIDSLEKRDLNNEKVKLFLLNLVLLEYNDFWRRSHPAVRLLEGYIEASEKAQGDSR